MPLWNPKMRSLPLQLLKNTETNTFEKKVLCTKFASKREEVIGEWRRLSNRELRSVYS